MDLIIDIGNSRIKVASFDKGTIQSKNYCSDNELLGLLVCLFSAKKTIDKVLVSSVREFNFELDNYLNSQCKKAYYLSNDLSIPLQIVYKSPQSLGPDRIALAVGASKLHPKQDVLAIDAGTCITYDFVSAAGLYLGGGISPGLQMRFKALSEFTDKLPLVDFHEEADLIGVDTESSIRSGVVNGMLKEMDGIIEAYKKRYPSLKVLLTGGDCDFFDKKLKNSIFADADLLLKGMHYILEHHAKIDS